MLPPPELRSRTEATVDLAPQLGMDGGLVAVVMIKQRFAVDERGRTERIGGAEIAPVDEPWDPAKPDASSTKIPSDVCMRKPGTDVIVVGSAYAVSGASKAVDVMFRVGPIEKAVRVTGPRVWYRGMGSLSLTPPEPFESLELRWEDAWGGFDASDPSRPAEEPRNPVGKGVVSDPKTLVHQPGPRIEDPRDPISGRGRHAPVGVGAIGRHWVPRRAYAGTYDEEWKRTRMPLLPFDFDERFHQASPPDQITQKHLRGGEPVQLLNLNAKGPMTFDLPKLAFYVGARLDGEITEHSPVLDTVLLQPTYRWVDLTWRAQVRMPRPLSRLHYIQVHEKRFLS